MTPRRQRMIAVALIATGVSVGVTLALRAFNDNLLYYHDPSGIAAGEHPAGQRFRLGGMVTDGSIRREPGSLKVAFDVTDYRHSVTVEYAGVLPDLFRDGQGVVVIGRLADNGVFVADEVLAKHDENYMPPEVAESLKAGRETPPAGTGYAAAPAANSGT